MKQAYSIPEVATLLGATVPATRALCELVFAGPRDVLAFTELVLLREAHALWKQKVSKARIVAAMAQLRSAAQPLSGAAVVREGKELVVVEGAKTWNAESGQGLLSFTGHQARTSWLRPVSTRDAGEHYRAAVALEAGGELERAMETYTDALAVDPFHADAHVNLGRLLHQRRAFTEAEAHYVAALVARPTDVTATFNLAVLLDDLGRVDDAIARYQQVIELAPSHVDAYFNLSRLYERRGEKVAAIRHLKDYRRLTSLR
jgi:tetratricopeptide (TPR) repeat protein